MRSTQYLLAAILALGLSGPAFAQGTATSTTSAPHPGQWTITGFIGGNFSSGASGVAVGPAGNLAGFNFANGGGVEYGTSIGYQWRRIVGAEFIGSWAPSYNGFTAFAINTNNNPHLDAYMANAIAMIPIGSEARFQPYVSGGIGGITLSADVLTVNGVLVTQAGTVANVVSTRASRTGFGTDIGGGVMAFATDRVGFRGDVRYYHASTDNNLQNITVVQDGFVQGALSGLHFWRADGGVTFRW